MVNKKNKKAVSPIISTVLLIMIVVIIAIIILVWSMAFIKEAVLKEIAGKSKRVEQYCSSGDLQMQQILNEDLGKSFGFINTGNIPIYAVNLKLVSSGGNSEIIEIEKSVNPGFSLIMEEGGTIFNRDDYEKIIIVPVLLGETKSGVLTEKVCPENTGLIIK
jgi:flagellin-like protein